jgi:hypothetical protein
MSEKMQTGRTYQRPPSKSNTIVGGSGSTAGKTVGKKAPIVVNNSTQGRTLPKKER